MRISHRYRFIFLANPRTASTSVRKVLDRYSDIKSVHISEINSDFPFYDHISALELKNIFQKRGWDWDSYHKFCVVRNPFDRVVSLYHHKLKNIREWDKRMGFLFNIARKLKYFLIPNFNFEKYVSLLDSQKRLTTSLQNFAFDEDGSQLVNDIIKYEDLGRSLISILKKIGIDIEEKDIPVLNTSGNRGEHQKYYCEKSRKRVEKLYYYELERFNYKF